MSAVPPLGHTPTGSPASRKLPPPVPGKAPGLPPKFAMGPPPSALPGQLGGENKRMSLGAVMSFHLQIDSDPPVECLIDPRKPLKALIERACLNNPEISTRTHVARDPAGNLIDLSKTFPEVGVHEIAFVLADEATLAQAATMYSLDPTGPQRSVSEFNVSQHAPAAEPSAAPQRVVPLRPTPGQQPAAPGVATPPQARPVPLGQGALRKTTSSDQLSVNPPASTAPPVASNTTSFAPPSQQKQQIVIPSMNRPKSQGGASLDSRLLAAETRMASIEESMTQNHQLIEKIFFLLQKSPINVQAQAQ